MILEQISKTNDTKSIHVISLDHNELRLGRGKDLDIRISDISVSRVHAILKIEQKQVLLYDNQSKFGTLVLI